MPSWAGWADRERDPPGQQLSTPPWSGITPKIDTNHQKSMEKEEEIMEIWV
jgi:hypothetical protein